MKVEVLSSECDYRDFVCIKIDGKIVASFADGEPEDNSLGRNFNDVHKIGELMKLAFEAGKNDDSFDYEYKKLSIEEYEEAM